MAEAMAKSKGSQGWFWTQNCCRLGPILTLADSGSLQPGSSYNRNILALELLGPSGILAGSSADHLGPSGTGPAGLGPGAGPNLEGPKMQSSLQCWASQVTDEDTAAAAQRTALIEVNTKVVQQLYTPTLYTYTATTWKTATRRIALIRVNANVVQQMYTVYTVTADTAETRKVAVGRDKSRKEDTAAATQRIGLLYTCTAATQKTALIREASLDEDATAATRSTI